MGIEVFYGPGQPPFDTWIKAAGTEFDTILVSRPEVAEDVIPAIRRHSHSRILYFGHDLHFRRMRQQADLTQDERLLRLAEVMREREDAIWRKADLSLYLSEEEAQIASVLQPDANIGSIVPYCFDRFAGPRSAPPGRDIIFVGGFGHPPNEDAALWFVNEILPRIRADVPEAHLSIIGSNPTERIRALARDGIVVRANVTDAELEAAYDCARVAVVPLRFGAGVKLKVVEALRAGVPLVTTAVGAQGLSELSHAVAVEDDPASFANAVIALLQDAPLWQLRNRQQVAFAQARFSREAMTASLLAALASAA
jgi:glycosyltransferase involved in cell wall biosynthesis